MVPARPTALTALLALLAVVAMQLASPAQAWLPHRTSTTIGSRLARAVSVPPSPRRGVVLGSAAAAAEDNTEGLEVGSKVKVTAEGVKFMHVGKKGPLDPLGLEGVVARFVLEDRDGREVSSNRPVVVKFTDPKFMAHFEFGELSKLD